MTASRIEDDQALLDGVRAGDAAALSALLSRYAPTVMRFAMKMCRDGADAEDVLQDTLLAAARGVRDLRGGAAVSTWLYTVARSYCIKKRRRGKHAPTGVVALDAPESEAIASPEAEPDEAASQRELGVALEQAIASLDDTAREVIVLRDVEGLSAAETAEVLGTTVMAVKSRLHRARADLRLRLLPYLAPAEPTPRVDPACPDIVDILSQHLEGDIGADACAAMEKHVASCSSCSQACASLRRAVGLCATSRHGALAPEVAAQVRRAVEKVVRSA